MPEVFPLDIFIGLLFIAGGIAVVAEIDKAFEIVVLLMIFLIGSVYHKRSKVILDAIDDEGL